MASNKKRKVGLFNLCKSLFSAIALLLVGASLFTLVGFSRYSLPNISNYLANAGFEEFLPPPPNFDDPICNWVANDEFDSDTSYWSLYVQSGSSATWSIDNSSQLSGVNSAVVNIASTGGNEWDIELNQAGHSIVTGTDYSFRFDARSLTNRDITVAIQQNVSPWTEYYLDTISLTTTATEYGPYTLTSPVTDADTRVIFRLGSATDNVYIDDVIFGEANCFQYGSGSTTISSQINSGLDDVEEQGSDGVSPGLIVTVSTDLELVYDPNSGQGTQIVGMRFNNINVPQGAVITDAYITFTSDVPDIGNPSNSSGTKLEFSGQDIDNAPAFSTTDFYVSTRTMTSAVVGWSPPPWSSGAIYNTPSLDSIVKEIVDRPGWISGNSMMMTVVGENSGGRVADSYDGSSTDAPILYISYEDENSYPVAVDDNDTATANIAMTTIDVTANDTDAELEALTVIDFTQSPNGTVVNNANGTFGYTPDLAYVGTDSFDYLVIDDGSSLLHHWGLNGNGTDGMGATTGTINGTTTASGVFGDALSFNESLTDYVQFPDFPYNDVFTIAFDFKVDDNNGTLFQYLFSHGDINGFNSINIFLNEDAHSTSPDTLRTVIRDNNDPLSNTDLQFDAGPIIGDGLWHNYTLVVSSSGSTVYLDGTQMAFSSLYGGDNMNPSTDLFLAGRQDLAINRFYGGHLDNVQIYSGPLISGEVTDLNYETNRGTVNLLVNACGTPINGCITVNSTGDGADLNPGDGICADSNCECTLRAAIEEANALAGRDTICFNIPGPGVHLISPATALPQISDTLYINGTSEPDFSTTPVIRVDGNSLAGGIDAFTFSSSSDYSQIRSLMITRFPRHGLFFLNGADDMTVSGNWIGTDGTGATSMGNGNSGIVSQGGNFLIGGTGIYDQNVIVNNSNEGISISGSGAINNNIIGNLIGLEPDGVSGAGNGDIGIALVSTGGGGNTIGGTTTAGRNIISMNNEGIEIGSSNNIVQGNRIGTDINGTLDLGNSSHGIEILNGATNTTIGGTTMALRNIISGNDGQGLEIVGATSTGTIIQGNFIGTDSTGNLGLRNEGNGIRLNGNVGTVLGGTASGAGNVISGNDNSGSAADGIYISGGSGHTIQGNIIGLGVDSSTVLGNYNAGIAVNNSVNNLIGGIANNAGNIIAYNTNDGIQIQNSSAINNSILGNSIYSNGGIGIDLGANGVTSNDAGDGDTGPNDYLNFIEFNTLFLSGGDLNYDFNADLSLGDYRIEFFNNPSGADVSGFGEGELLIGAIQINHGGTGTTNFTGSFTPLSTVNDGDEVSAVTIECQDGTCNTFWATSEFSASENVVECIPANAPTVNAGSDESICDGDDTTITAVGTGGTGTLTYNWDNGLGAGASHLISPASTTTYMVTVTDTNGCTGTNQVQITVNPLPVVNLTLADDEECVNTTIMTLDGGSPSGGVYSGAGVSGGNFNASIAGLGVHTITYTYTDSNGCTNIATDDITVFDLPAVTLSLTDDTDCVTDNILTLSGGLPAGGTFSGVGVSGTNFDASVAGAGVHVITYTYTDVTTGCTNIATDNIAVFSLPTVSLTLPDIEDCALNNTLALSGGLPLGGTFSGTGVGGTNFDASAAGLGVHTITYTYTDSNGCINTATDDITVVTPPSVTLILAIDEDCAANSSLTLSGGSPVGGVYSGTGVSGNNFDASSAGTGSHNISYTYTDANGCFNTASDAITVYAQPTFTTVTPTNPTICGGNDGNIAIVASGGTGNFEYRLDGGSWQASSSFIALTAGSYNIYIRNNNGFCEVPYASNSVVLTDPSSPTAEINLPSDGCVDASSNFVATDAGVGATYAWNFGAGASPATATGLGPHAVSFNSSGSKSINLTVTLSGCTSGDGENFTVHDLPVVSLTLPDTEECVSSTTLSLSGGSPSGGSFSGVGVSGSNFNASTATSGTHTITYTYTDVNGCINTATDDIEVYDLPVVNLALGVDEACVSSTTLTLSGASPAGGSYSGSGVSGTNFNASSAGAGAHTITYTYTDSNGCVNTSTDIIDVFDFPNIDNVNSNNPSSCGATNGSISITLSGGSGAYQYRLNSGSWQSGNTFNSLVAGVYNITVRNNNGLCELTYASNPVTLVDPPGTVVNTSVTSDHTGEDISCVGSADGSAIAVGSGGTSPYSYTWSNGQVGQNLINVAAGTYTVLVTDAFGCQGVGSITLNDPPALGVSATFTDVSCYAGSDGAIDVTAIGGVGAYTYAWDDLDPEAYWAMDGNTDDISGNNHHAIGVTGTITYSNDAVDGNQSLLLDGNSGIRYDDGTFLDSPIPYRSVLMWIKPDDFNEKYMLYDEGGFISGIALAFDQGELIATARNSFISRTAFSMTVPNDGQWHQVGFIYDNGIFTLTVDGVLGTSFVTGFTTINLSPLLFASSGVGISFGTNALGSNSFKGYAGLMDNVEIYNSALQTSQISDIYTDDGDRSGLPAGDYTVYVYDLNGCIDSVSLTLSQPDSLALTANITDVLCNGDNNGEIDMIISGGVAPFSQSWSTGASSEDITSLGIGTYIVTVTDDNGCSVVDSFMINEPAVLTASASVTSNFNGFNISCFGATDGTATVTPVGGTSPYSYSWSNGQTGENLINAGAGSYTVIVTDDSGCTTSASVSLTNPPQVTVTTSVTSSYNGEDISCVGAADGSASANASNGVGTYTYVWSNGQTGPNLTGVIAGTYSVLATDENGCTASAIVTLQDPPPIIVTTSVTSNYNGAHVSCAGSTDGSADVSASGGSGTYTYSWSNGQNGPNLTAVGAGTYTVIATDAYGCTGTQTVTLVNPADMGVTINVTSSYNGFDLSCSDESDGSAQAIGSGGTGAYSYSWSNGQNTANLTNVAAGTYTVTTMDANGCTATSSVTLTAPSPLTFSVSSSAPSDCGVDDGIILFSASGGIGTYEYSIDGSSWQSVNSFTGLTPGTYFTYVRNATGTCQQGPTAITVNIPEAPTIDNITIINPTTGVSTDGGVLVTSSGNGLAIEYSINGSTWQPSNLFSNLSIGSYTLSIRYTGFNCISSSPITLTAGGGVVGSGGGTNYCSDDLSGVNFVETYYIPFPEDQVFTSLTSIFPGSSTCGFGSDVSDPVISYNSIGIVESGTIIYFDHWEDGYEINSGFPIQPSSQIWGDGILANGVAPGYPLDVLTAGDIIVLQDNVVSTTRATVTDYDGGDKISSRGNLAFTRLVWTTGPGTLFAGAIEVYPSILWGSSFEIPVGENADVNDMFDYVGAVIMAAEDSTVVTIDTDGNGSIDITTTINEGQSYLLDGNLNSGATINSTSGVQVHLLTGSYCQDYETRWFTLKSTDTWSDSYFNPVSTQNGSGSNNDPTYVHLYNPNSTGITVRWETTSATQSDINIPAGGTAWREIPNNTGSHFYTTNSMDFYAIATIDSDEDELIHDWGYAILPESQLTGQITMVGFAPGETPGASSGSNTSPVWITPGYPSSSSSSGSITICIDYNGNGGSLTDLNGTSYDASLVLNELALAKLYDPDGDQTGMRIWVCDGSDAIIAGAWGQDPSASDGPGSSNEMDLGTGLPNGIPFAASKCADLSKDYNSNGLYDECDEVIYTLEIRNSGSLPLSTGSLNILDSLPPEVTYIENTTQTIINSAVTAVPDDTNPSSAFPLDESGFVFNSVVLPGDSIIFRFEVVINDIPGAMFITNTAQVSSGQTIIISGGFDTSRGSYRPNSCRSTC